MGCSSRKLNQYHLTEVDGLWGLWPYSDGGNWIELSELQEFLKPEPPETEHRCYCCEVWPEEEDGRYCANCSKLNHILGLK